MDSSNEDFYLVLKQRVEAYFKKNKVRYSQPPFSSLSEYRDSFFFKTAWETCVLFYNLFKGGKCSLYLLFEGFSSGQFTPEILAECQLLLFISGKPLTNRQYVLS